VVNYEDRTFYRHIGVSGRGIGRALRDNWRAGQIVSGGSTLTMQVARMARGNQARTLVQKLLEAVWATRLEVRYSKAEILRFWLANAPFGGNVVGAEAAVRRYYARPPTELSWAEAATLAVLPNSPALLHPGRGRDELRAKRDRLLEDLVIAGHLTAEQAELAKLEPLPDKPQPLPRQAEHLLERLRQEQGPGRYRSSLPADLQAGVTELVNQHQALLAGNQIRNAAAMVTEVATGRVVAYVGNTNSPTVLRSGVEIPAAPSSFRQERLTKGALPNQMTDPMVYYIRSIGASSIIQEIKSASLNEKVPLHHAGRPCWWPRRPHRRPVP
jgi:penicillin-binding protein 1C